jgi:hypothetical protein
MNSADLAAILTVIVIAGMFTIYYSSQKKK